MSLAFKPSSGLGNILFMHHAAYTYARNHNLELCAVGHYPSAPDRPAFAYYSKLFKHVKLVESQTPVDYMEPNLMYSPIPPGVRSIQGYFQSYKYFDKYQIELRDLLHFNEIDTWQEKVEKFSRISGGEKTVCVHIRRGDYHQSPIHRCIPEEYYINSISKFSHHRFIVFSDGLDEVKSWGVWKDLDVAFVEDEPSALGTFFLMSMCDHFVIANSTLSLMAYYMRENRDGTITAPSPWFEQGGPEIHMNDLIDCII